MDANECRQERFSSRTIGLFFLIVSFLLFVIGMLIIPVIGFVFAAPFVIIGAVMLTAPESEACQMIRRGLKPG